jgi:hypothetical protein
MSLLCRLLESKDHGASFASLNGLRSVLTPYKRHHVLRTSFNCSFRLFLELLEDHFLLIQHAGAIVLQNDQSEFLAYLNEPDLGLPNVFFYFLRAGAHEHTTHHFFLLLLFLFEVCVARVEMLFTKSHHISFHPQQLILLKTLLNFRFR